MPRARGRRCASATWCWKARSPTKVHGDPARLQRIRAAVMPKIDKPILFDTPEADAVVSALEVFPPDNPWNLVIEDWPLHLNSKEIIESIGANKKLRYNTDMCYVLVPPDQKKVGVKLGSAAAESDKGPYPVPDNTPIEGYPINYKGLTLDEVQRKDEGDIDRHALVVDPANRMLYEFYQMRKTDRGWIASGAAIFDWTISVTRRFANPALARRVQQDQGLGVRGGGTHSRSVKSSRSITIAPVWAAPARAGKTGRSKVPAPGPAPGVVRPASSRWLRKAIAACGNARPSSTVTIRPPSSSSRPRLMTMSRWSGSAFCSTAAYGSWPGQR